MTGCFHTARTAADPTVFYGILERGTVTAVYQDLRKGRMLQRTKVARRNITIRGRGQDKNELEKVKRSRKTKEKM